MKKILALLFAAALLVLGLSSCTAGTTTQKSDKLSVVATIFPPFDFARQVGKEKVDVSILLPPGGESHTYEPTPDDIIKIQNADIFIFTGGENDTWIDEILKNVDTSKMKILRMMDCVETVDEETVEGMQGGHSESDHQDGDHEPDEHVWTSPKNAMLIARAIETAMAEKDIKNADFYNSNFIEYEKALSELDSGFKTAVESGKRDTVIFGDRFPFRYFADEYGLKYFASFPGCSGESEPSAKTVAFLIEKIKAEKIPIVFHIEFSNHKSADTIAEATGTKILQFHSCHNVTKEEMDNGETYISLMEKNLEALKIALS